MRIEHTIDIDASVERVWALTIDVESWPDLTPTMSAIERLDHGPIAPASEARVKQPGQRAKVWKVTTVEPDHRFAWSARLLGTEMTASHVLEPHGDGTTNTLVLDLEGRGASLVGRLLGGQIRKSLATENEGFKRAAEG